MDAELVDRVLSGDQDAFGELVGKHQRWVTVVALRSTGNLEEADDVAQDTFLRAYRALPGWRREASFATWLGQILRNRLRDRGRRGPVSEDPLDTASEPVAEPEQEQSLLDAEMLGALREAYEALPEGRQRQVIRLRFLEGKRLEEIATELGLRVGTVKAHLFRGTQRLKGILSGPKEVS